MRWRTWRSPATTSWCWTGTCPGCTATRSAGRSWLRVGNTGAVIPPGQVGRLFEPFQRLSGQRTGNGDGYGLGLAIVRAIADAHGATVTPRARPEGGLDLEVSFPGKPVGALPGAVAASAGE